MANPNYTRGRAYEYEVMKEFEGQGYSVIRASGSHGEYDVVAYRSQHPVEFVQCKVVRTETEANRMIKKFKEDTIPSKYYHQSLKVKVLRSGVIGVTV